MKKFYIVVEVEKGGKKHAHTITTTKRDNIYNILNNINNIITASIYSTKKEAIKQVQFLQDVYKKNGVNLY